jgi:hypothetical protein
MNAFILIDKIMILNLLLIMSLLLMTMPVRAATDIAPAESTDPAELPNVVPSKVENADSAFAKLDIGKKGYLTLEDTKVLSGFDKPFKSNDKNSDGKLSPEEFMPSWEAYTGIHTQPENFQRKK